MLEQGSGMEAELTLGVRMLHAINILLNFSKMNSHEQSWTVKVFGKIEVNLIFFV